MSNSRAAANIATPLTTWVNRAGAEPVEVAIQEILEMPRVGVVARVTPIDGRSGTASGHWIVGVASLHCARCNDDGTWCPDILKRWPIAANARERRDAQD